MTDVGLAQLKELDLNTRHDLDHPDGLEVSGWSLLEEWGEGEGVEEHSKVIGLEQFLRAERTLAQPATADQIDSTHLVLGILGDRHDEHETFQYSVKETGREQHNPDGADDNLVTDLGRLKRGIGDPDASTKRGSKAARTQRLLMELDAHERMLAQLYQQIAALNEQIADLQNKIDQYDQQLANIDEMQQLLDEGHDFNDNTSQGRRLRRGLSQGGMDTNVTRPDGTIDSDAAARAMEERRAEIASDRETAIDTMDVLVDKRDRLVEQAETLEQDRSANMSTTVAEGIDATSVADVQSFTNVTSFYASTDLIQTASADDVAFSAFSTDVDAPDAEVMAFYADDNMGFGAPEAAPIQAAFSSAPSSDVSMNIASAFNADPTTEGSNVITAAFTQVSDLELAEAKIAEAEAAQTAAQEALVDAEAAADTTAQAPSGTAIRAASI